jgi:Uma2 family endonuclease
MEAGVKEVFLVHPKNRSVYVFTDSGVEEIQEATSVISRYLPGFKLECSMIWEDL